jgi:hypothetical protein
LQAGLRTAIGYSKQGRTLRLAISTLPAVSVLDFEIASLGRAWIELCWSLLDKLVLIW